MVLVKEDEVLVGKLMQQGASCSARFEFSFDETISFSRSEVQVPIVIPYKRIKRALKVQWAMDE